MTRRDRSAGRPVRFGAGFAMLVVAVLVVGLNQRPAITTIPPIQDVIADELGIGPALTGAITSIPLVCFALVGLVVPALVRRFDVDRVMLGGLVLLAVAVAVRPWAGITVFLAGTVAAGAAITIANVLQPVVVRRDAPPHRVGTLMPLSTAALSMGAALASFVAVDSEQWIGWRPTLALVAVPVAVAVAVWMVRMRATRRGRVVDDGPAVASPVTTTSYRSAWSEGSAWWLAAFFAIQSTLFYATAAWLPSLIADRAGASRVEGGYALTLYFLFGILGSLVTPLLVRVLGSYRSASPVPGTLWGLTYLGLLFAPQLWPVWSVVAGVAQGVGIGVALTLVAVRPVDVVHGRAVSSMVQSAGYALAALGPVVFGWLFGLTGGWFAPCLLGLGLATAQNISGWPASADKPIGLPKS